MDEKPRNEDLNQKYKKDIRLNTKLLSELSLGTPVIAAIKKKIDEMHGKRVINEGNGTLKFLIWVSTLKEKTPLSLRLK